MRAAPWRVAGWALLAGLAAGPSSCARNPATGKNEISLVSESQEIQMGQEYAQQIVRSMGVYDDKKVQDYVSRLGMAIAVKSERPQPALGVLRDGRSDGQRLRAAWRLHLHHPGHPDPHEQRGRADRSAGARDRSRDRPPLGAADDASADRPDRPRRGQHHLLRRRPVRRTRLAGPGGALPQVRA